jgi:hypothetical protein
MDQPSAEQALKEMEVLVGEWSQTAASPGHGSPPAGVKAAFEWLEGGQLLLERSTVEMPEAPDAVCVYGCDAANGTYYQLYTDVRNVGRVYQMSIGNGEWKLWREGEPFNQHQIGGRHGGSGRDWLGLRIGATSPIALRLLASCIRVLQVNGAMTIRLRRLSTDPDALQTGFVPARRENAAPGSTQQVSGDTAGRYGLVHTCRRAERACQQSVASSSSFKCLAACLAD